MKGDVRRYTLFGAFAGVILGLQQAWEWLRTGGEGISYGAGLILGTVLLGGVIGYVIGLVRSRNAD